MNRLPKQTKNSPTIALYIIVSEILFWILMGIILWIFGFYSTASTDEKLIFRREENLYLLLLLIPVIISFLWYVKNRAKRFARLGTGKIVALITQSASPFSVFLRFFFLRTSLVFLIFAMAQPSFGTQKVSATVESMELVLAIDVSNSMNTKDIDSETSRLEIVKRAMIQLLNRLHGERIGLCVFAGGAYLQLPLTSDYGAAKMYINEIETDMISNQGTNVSAALELSVNMFSKDKSSKAILLVTDGENHEGGLDETVSLLQKNQISLAILGIGTSSGGVIPKNPYRKEMGYKKDASGNTVISKLNSTFIKNLAQQTNAYAVVSSSAFPNLEQIVQQIKKMKRKKITGLEMDVKVNWFQIPLLIAILSFMLYVFPISWKGR